MSEEYAAIFKEEAKGLLEKLESALLELESNPHDLSIIGRVFRTLHTIKGSGSMFGFTEIAEFTHEIETILDKVRDGSVPVDKQLIDLILASRDHIANLLDPQVVDNAVDVEPGKHITAKLQELMVRQLAVTPQNEIEEMSDVLNSLENTVTSLGISGTSDHENNLESPVQEISVEENSSLKNVEDSSQVSPTEPGMGPVIHYRVTYKPSPDFFINGGVVEDILSKLDSIGEFHVTGHSQGSALEYAGGIKQASWDLILHTSCDLELIRSTFLPDDDGSDLVLFELEGDEEYNYPEHRKLGEILVERGDLDKKDLDETLVNKKRLGEMLVAEKKVESERVDSALNEQKVLQDGRKTNKKPTDSLRVAAEKLDHLINLVGEMVVIQSRLSQVVMGRDEAELIEPVEEVERLTAELRDCVLNIRMLPIGTTFSRYRRLVRDLSTELGKEVELVMEGAETELDKSVLELLGDPLIHLIRNCIDHGIELPEERLAVGKESKGVIKLIASYSGANVIIHVEDDGRGLDTDKIRAQALSKGVISADKEMNGQEIYDLIFGAGLSTASTVTGISGRGVGMDVVKNTIEGRLKGVVGVKSKDGAGTTIYITLPLTLAIIDGLLVKVGDTHFVLPLTQVEECVELTVDDVARFHGRHVYSVRGHLVPYVNLRQFYGINGHPPALQQMVIVNVNGERVGLVLDDVVGGHQTVIKSLGWAYRNAEGVSGATILGSGEVALIVDVANLVRFAQYEEMVNYVHDSSEILRQ